MPIVGFNYDEINVTKKKTNVKGNINIKSDVGITDVKEEELPTGKEKSKGLRFNFKYHIDYQPGIGHIKLNGFIYYLDDPKTIKEILAEWKKNKKISDKVTHEIINAVLFRSTVKALNMAQEVNLPPHMPLPRVNPQTKAKNYIG